MEKHIKKITAAAVLVMIAITGILTLLDGDSERGEVSPEMTLSSVYDGSFSKNVTSDSAEKLIFREKMISFRSKLVERFGGRIVNGVYIGKDRLLDAEMSEHTTEPSAADRINAFARKYNGTVYIAAIPSSSGVYGEIMPDYLLSDPESQKITRFYDQLDSSIRRIDAYNILKMLKDNYIYFRTDTKWTSYGAYCIYRTVIQKLGFQPITYDKYTIRHVTDDFCGNLYQRTLYPDISADILDIYEYPDGVEVRSCVAADKNGLTHEIELYDMDMLETSNMYDMYLGAPEAVVEIETNINNQRRLLVIKDSYADCFIPFLTQHFSKITVISPEYMDGQISDYINISDYEQTLILFGIENSGESALFSGILQ